MKKFMKTCGISAAVMIVAGLVMVLIAGAVKGPEVLGALGNYALNTIEKLDSDGHFDLDDVMNMESEVPVLVGSAAQTYTATEIVKLDAEVGACQLSILPSEDQNLHVHTEGIGSYQGYVEDGTLHLNAMSSAGEIKLFVPADFYFEEVKLSIGAGAISGSSSWETGTLEVELAAGEVKLSNVEVGSLNAEVGAGAMAYEGSILKEADVECGMGEINLKLDDSQADYNYDVEVAAGEVTIGSESFGGIAGERNINNNAAKNINVECAMGSIEVAFAN